MLRWVALPRFLAMTACGSKQTSRHVRSNVANGVKADIIGSL
jgi:hypothetical protein